MGFFSRKKAEVEENNESILKEVEKEVEKVERHQNEFKTKQINVNDNITFLFILKL